MSLGIAKGCSCCKERTATLWEQLMNDVGCLSFALMIKFRYARAI